VIGARRCVFRAARARARTAIGAASIAALVSCAHPAVELPTGAGDPYPGYEAALARAIGTCRAVTTFTAELALSGRAGKRRLRGRVLTALGTPGRIRLEGLAPFGAPAFILVADGADSTLLLPRDRRVLRGTPADRIIEALTGVRLDPDQLLALVSGCATPSPTATSGTRYGDTWIAIGLEGGGTVFLDGREPTEIRAARVGALTVEYSEYAANLPGAIRVRSAAASDSGAVDADLTIRVSDLETNVSLEPNVFEVKVPDDAAPLTLEELREAGPLGSDEGT
jgi:hypothetical protein